MFFDITQQYFALLPKVNFPANNLNFGWDQIHEISSIRSTFYLCQNMISSEEKGTRRCLVSFCFLLDYIFA